jgi:hypothetical protein
MTAMLRTVSVVMMLAGSVCTAGAQEPLAEGKDFVYVCRDGGNGAYEAFPDVCRLKDGRLLSVFYDSWEHVGLPKEGKPNGGRVSGAYSGDEGKTWGAPFVVYDGPNDDRDPSVVQLADGRILCNFFSLKTGPDGKGYAGLGSWLVESSDAGKTWSAARPICNEDYYCSSPIRELPDGTLILGLYAEKGGDGFGASTTSKDGGKTWTTVVNIPNGGARLDAETDIIRLNDGRLYAAQRSPNESMRFSVSADNGATWSTSEVMGFAGHSPYLHRAPGGTILCAFRWHAKNGTYLCVSTDECKTWTAPILVDSFIGAYPSMVTLKDGSILIVYYEEGGGSNIRARKFRVNGAGVDWLSFQ